MLIIPHLILKKDDKFLLTRRAPTQKIWANHWHCVTGTIEKGESPKEAIIREAWEELNININNISLATTIFLKEKDYFEPLKKFYAVELFFLSHLENNQIPINAEPLKQDALDWFTIDVLPKPMIPGVKFGLECHSKNLHYAEFRNV